MAVIFIDSGFLQFVAGIVLGAVFAVGAFVLAFPAVLVIVVSAVSGAPAIVNGVFILLGTIKVEDLERRRLRRPAQLRPGRIIAWIVIAIAAVLFQTRDVARMGPPW